MSLSALPQEVIANAGKKTIKKSPDFKNVLMLFCVIIYWDKNNTTVAKSAIQYGINYF